MKALVFKEGVSQWAEDGEKVTCVILVPDKSPSLSDIKGAYYKFHRKKLEQISKQLEKKRKTVPAICGPTKDKNGNYTASFQKRFEDIKRQKKFDMASWILKNYNGKLINFDENY